MTKAIIQFHAKAIANQTAEMEAATEAGDMVTAGMIWDAIQFRKVVLAKHGVFVV